MVRLLAVALLLAAAASGAGAQDGQPYESRFDVPERPSPPRLVNDLTGTLSGGEREALERKLVAFADSTGSQVAVVLVPTTDDVAPVDYATEILREWGVGRAGVDDGVVLLVAVEDREVFIATGFGAEGALTDATAGTIVRTVIVPRFRQGAFYAGIDEATDAIVAALSGEFEAPPPGRSGGGGDGAIGSVLCCLFILFVFLVVLSSRQSPPPSSGGRRRRRSGPGVIVLPGFGWGGGFGGGSGGFGGGGFGGGGFGGGGFGGFGGGFGGGGGAGGSW